EECLIQPESFDAALGVFRSFARRHNLSAYDSHSHKGFLRHAILRQSKASGEMVAVLITERGELPDAQELLDGLRRACPGLRGFLWGVNSGLADVARIEEERFQWGDLFFHESLGGVRYRISAFSFFQTNSLGAKQLYDVIRRFLDGGPTDSLLDAYCGIGAIGLYCADTVGKVFGIDNVVSSIWDARENAALNGLNNCTFFAGDVRERLPLMLNAGTGPITRVVVDPPRGGMDKKVLRNLLELGAQVFVYVSCNPSTMARDVVAISEAGYELEEIQPVDMFPHTYHIETVIRCVKR
ncbi:MAG: 23S rRNA (uracil(1939)-C(5))-methyltransferase RlmD, partial [bacterium]